MEELVCGTTPLCLLQPQSLPVRAPSNFSAFSNSSSSLSLPLTHSPLPSLPPSLCVALTHSLSLLFPPSSSDTHQSLPEAVIGQLSFSIRQSPEIPSWAQWVPTPKMRKKKSSPVVYIYCATDSTNSLRAV